MLLNTCFGIVVQEGLAEVRREPCKLNGEWGRRGLAPSLISMEAYMVCREVSAFAVVRAVPEVLWSCNTRLAVSSPCSPCGHFFMNVCRVGKIVGTITSARARD